VRTPAIEVVKDADRTAFDAAGETITYSFTATNTGNVTLSDVVITDPLPGLSALTCAPAAPAALAPGEELDCSATYEVTQADVDAGIVDNTATATGDDPAGDPVTDDDDALVPGVRAGAIDLTKSADVASVDAVGDLVTYTFDAVNAGNVTLTDVEIVDPLPGLSTLSCLPSAPATLEPGDHLVCTATYEATQGDLDAGAIDNTATVTGTDPDGGELTDDDTVRVPATQSPAIDLVKDVDRTRAAAGDTLTYTFSATNTGTVTLSDVEIVDPLPGLSALECDPDAPATLAPGEALECSATYVVTRADADRGEVLNRAEVIGDDPSGTPVIDTDEAEVPVDPTGTSDGGDDTGDDTGSPVSDIVDIVRTGTDARTLSLLGGALALAGVAFVLLGRRRRLG
jgi:uncharacterized repeat protein (TIGR01451 family)